MTTLLLLLVLAAFPPASGDPPGPTLDALEGGRSSARGLVVFLHGGSFDGTPAVDLARRALSEVSSAARKEGLKVLVPVAPPGCTSSVPFLEPEGEAAVLDALEAELARRRVDPGRVTLAGFGSGGTAALVLAARHAGRFAAVAAWSAAPPPLWERLPDGGRRAVGLAPDPVPELGGVPVFLFTADDDKILDREALALFVGGMSAASARDPTWELTWERGRGGHGFGSDGPRAGLHFLAGHRQRERP
jgi:pimeloyl-ACP methyl ester carboxylesterase